MICQPDKDFIFTKTIKNILIRFKFSEIEMTKAYNFRHKIIKFLLLKLYIEKNIFIINKES